MCTPSITPGGIFSQASIIHPIRPKNGAKRIQWGDALKLKATGAFGRKYPGLLSAS
jgi:hypothetical protein